LGERGDVIPLGFVADDERFRVRVVVLATRVAIEGVDGDARMEFIDSIDEKI